MATPIVVIRETAFLALFVGAVVVPSAVVSSFPAHAAASKPALVSPSALPLHFPPLPRDNVVASDSSAPHRHPHQSARILTKFSNRLPPHLPLPPPPSLLALEYDGLDYALPPWDENGDQNGDENDDHRDEVDGDDDENDDDNEYSETTFHLD